MGKTTNFHIQQKPDVCFECKQLSGSSEIHSPYQTLKWSVPYIIIFLSL